MDIALFRSFFKTKPQLEKPTETSVPVSFLNVNSVFHMDGSIPYNTSLFSIWIDQQTGEVYPRLPFIEYKIAWDGGKTPYLIDRVEKTKQINLQQIKELASTQNLAELIPSLKTYFDQTVIIVKYGKLDRRIFKNGLEYLGRPCFGSDHLPALKELEHLVDNSVFISLTDDIDWSEQGYPNANFDHLYLRQGLPMQGTLAEDDVLQMMIFFCQNESFKTYFKNAKVKTVRIVAKNTPFSKNNIFNLLGFYWNSGQKNWHKIVHVTEENPNENEKVKGILQCLLNDVYLSAGAKYEVTIEPIHIKKRYI